MYFFCIEYFLWEIDQISLIFHSFNQITVRCLEFLKSLLKKTMPKEKRTLVFPCRTFTFFFTFVCSSVSSSYSPSLSKCSIFKSRLFAWWNKKEKNSKIITNYILFKTGKTPLTSKIFLCSLNSLISLICFSAFSRTIIKSVLFS